MVEVYTEPLCRRHFSGLVSWAVITRIAILLIAIACSLVIAFATGGFWVKIKPTLDQPTVQYSQDALLLVEGSSAGQEMIWSTSSTINAQFSSYYVPASIQVAAEDHNFDGRPDSITFVATVQSNAPVYGVKALVQFTYSFSSNVRLQMYGLAYISASSATPGGVLYTDGDLVLNQRSPITDRKYNDAYNYPILTSQIPSTQQAVQASTQLMFESIISGYRQRNYTTMYSNVYPVWKAASGNTFQLHMVIRIPPNQLVWYRPQVIEMLKFGWIQFLATFIVLWWFYTYLEMFIFFYRLIPTRVVSDVQPKMQRF